MTMNAGNAFRFGSMRHRADHRYRQSFGNRPYPAPAVSGYPDLRRNSMPDTTSITIGGSAYAMR